MATISKTTITFTVLHRTDEPIADLELALRESYDGHAVGDTTAIATVPVTDSQVHNELVALGNDGEFFDDDLEG